MKTKKRNPTDATLRNIRALKKRVKFLEEFLIEQCPETWKSFLAQKQAKK